MITNVYDGTIGSMTDTSKLVYALNEYAIQAEDSLNYEIKEDKTKVVIITGKNEAEKDLPLWSHPLVYKDTRGNDVVAIDMRAYVSNTIRDVVAIREVLQDKYNGTLQLYRLIYTKLILDDDTDWLPYVKNELMEALSVIITTTTSMALFDKTHNDTVDIITKLHFVSLLDELEDDLDKLLLKLPRKTIGELTHGGLKDVNRVLHTAYDNDDLILPSTTIGSLVNNIIATTSDRSKGLSPDIYIQSLSRGFFSLDTKYQSIAMLEDIPTLIAVLTMVISEGINSKSKFRKIIDSNKRLIKPKDMTKVLIKRYEEEFISY